MSNLIIAKLTSTPETNHQPAPAAKTPNCTAMRTAAIAISIIFLTLAAAFVITAVIFAFPVAFVATAITLGSIGVIVPTILEVLKQCKKPNGSSTSPVPQQATTKPSQLTTSNLQKITTTYSHGYSTYNHQQRRMVYSLGGSSHSMPDNGSDNLSTISWFD